MLDEQMLFIALPFLCVALIAVVVWPMERNLN